MVIHTWAKLYRLRAPTDWRANEERGRGNKQRTDNELLLGSEWGFLLCNVTRLLAKTQINNLNILLLVFLPHPPATMQPKSPKALLVDISWTVAIAPLDYIVATGAASRLLAELI